MKMKFDPCLFTENLTGAWYVKILESNLLHPRAGSKNGRTVFQQDNGRKHRSKLAVGWLNDRHINWTSDWPPQSPNLNRMENL
jgi:hypothetical protein